MTFDEDEAFARALQLQEERNYLFADHIGMDTDSEDEWDTRSRKKKGAKKVAKAKIVKEPKKPKRTAIAKETEEGSTNNGENKKIKKKPQGWTELEEDLFRKGLELYGREWENLAKHVGHNRDKLSVKSHAQKYFIKLYIAGTPLPTKVCESGDGYTLSGKPLDPESAALKAYSNGPAYRREIAARKENKENQNLRKDENGIENKSDNTENNSNTTTALPPKKVVQPKRIKLPKPKKAKKLPKALLEDEVVGARSSSRLKSTQQKSANYMSLDNFDGDPLQMVQCERYGNNRNNQQPFAVDVTNMTYLIMDFHAHLARSEIIGFLGGTYDHENKKLYIKEAFPCRAIDSRAGIELLTMNATVETNVEMDPESEFEVRNKITSKNLSVVGWYHSHPTFKPIPSNTDVTNQHNYQVLFHDEENKATPFVAAIVGPYDLEMPNEESVFNWFNVKDNGRRDPCSHTAMVLQTECDSEEELQSYIDTASKMRELVDYYKDFPYRVKDLNEVWKYCPARSDDISETIAEENEQSTESLENKQIARTLGSKLKYSILSRTDASIDGALTSIKESLSYLDDNWRK